MVTRSLISSVVLGNIFFVKKPDSGFGGFAGGTRHDVSWKSNSCKTSCLLPLLARQPGRGLSNAAGKSGVLPVECGAGMVVTSGRWAEGVRIGFW